MSTLLVSTSSGKTPALPSSVSSETELDEVMLMDELDDEGSTNDSDHDLLSESGIGSLAQDSRALTHHHSSVIVQRKGIRKKPDTWDKDIDVSASTSPIPGENKVSNSVPSTLGSIDDYIRTVNQFPILTEEEERQYARALRDHNNLEAAQRLVLSHLRLVVSITRGYWGCGFQRSDLIQEGNIGLMSAVRRFDPERGVRLSVFAVHWIKAKLNLFVMNNLRLIKMSSTLVHRKLFFCLRRMKAALGVVGECSAADAKQIASDLGIDPAEVIAMEQHLEGSDIPLEGGNDTQDDSRSDYHPIQYLTAPSSSNPEGAIQKQQTATWVQRALTSLDPRSQEIIRARVMVEKGEETPLRELSERFGISMERVRQIEVKALKQLKEWFEKQGIPDSRTLSLPA